MKYTHGLGFDSYTIEKKDLKIERVDTSRPVRMNAETGMIENISIDGLQGEEERMAVLTLEEEYVSQNEIIENEAYDKVDGLDQDNIY